MKLYRVEASASVSADDDVQWESLRLRHHSLTVREFEVIRETPKGKWINDFIGEKWVSNTTGKRYAYPTVVEAYQGFVRRRKNQKRILERQLDDCIAYMEIAEMSLERNQFPEPKPSRLR